MNNTKRYVIYKVCGRIYASQDKIKKGCLINKSDMVQIAIVFKEKVFTNMVEAVEAFEAYTSMYQSYSTKLHYIEEYKLVEENRKESKILAISDFSHFQVWNKKADGTRKFNFLTENQVPTNFQLRENEVGYMVVTTNGDVIMETYAH